MRAKSRPKQQQTRTRILETAVEVFARKGYRDARVLEICRRARANIAAVNYYFGGKENLYREALRLAFERSLQAHPLDGGVPLQAPAVDRLHGHIRSTIERITDPDGHEFDMLQKEMANPTGLVTETMRESVGPIRRAMQETVRELIGPKASETQVSLCQASVMGQCLHLMPRERPRFTRFAPAAPTLNARMAAEHVFRFSLAGIRDARRRIENADTSAGQT